MVFLLVNGMHVIEKYYKFSSCFTESESSTNHPLSLNANFANMKRTKMPYEEVYFQRMKEEHPEDYAELRSSKRRDL